MLASAHAKCAMLLNLNDAKCILAWWQVYPERHTLVLKGVAQLQPQFAPAIKAAWHLIALEAPRG